MSQTSGTGSQQAQSYLRDTLVSMSLTFDQSVLTSQPDEEVHHHFLQDAHILLHPTTLVGFLSDPQQSWNAHVGVELGGQTPAFLALILVMRKQHG